MAKRTTLSSITVEQARAKIEEALAAGPKTTKELYLALFPDREFDILSNDYKQIAVATRQLCADKRIVREDPNNRTTPWKIREKRVKPAVGDLPEAAQHPIPAKRTYTRRTPNGDAATSRVNGANANSITVFLLGEIKRYIAELEKHL
jgi:hypothetical protein